MEEKVYERTQLVNDEEIEIFANGGYGEYLQKDFLFEINGEEKVFSLLFTKNPGAFKLKIKIPGITDYPSEENIKEYFSSYYPKEFEFECDGNEFCLYLMKENFFGTNINWIEVARLMDLEDLEIDPDNDGFIQSVYLGSIISLCPSGKFYTPFANSNVDRCPECEGFGKYSICGVEHECLGCCGVTSREAHYDELYMEQLKKEAEHYGLCVTSGEGGMDDMFAARFFNDDEVAQDGYGTPTLLPNAFVATFTAGAAQVLIDEIEVIQNIEDKSEAFDEMARFIGKIGNKLRGLTP